MTQQNNTENQPTPQDSQQTPESRKHRNLLIVLTVVLVLPPLVLMTLRLMGKI